MSEARVDVTIFDTTPRDGAQALPPENQFGDKDKPAIADWMARLGVGVIEAGFPVTPGDAEKVRAVAKSVGRRNYVVDVWENGRNVEQVHSSPVITGLSRVKPGDIEVAWDVVKDARRSRIHTFVSTDRYHMQTKFPGNTPDEVRQMGSDAVRYAKQLTSEHPDATVEFSAEAASTTNDEYLKSVIKEAIYQGADVINVPDTVGQRDPMWMRNFYTRVIGWCMESNPDVTVSAHNHNDLGMAVANTGMLVQAAAQYAKKYDQRVRVQLETTVCGLGERAGNADVFPVAAGLFKFTPDMAVPVRWQLNPGQSVAVAHAVMGYAGLTVDRQSPVVGEDTNTHYSGIHSDGVLKGGYEIYTPFEPKFWGHGQNVRHGIGSYQGWKGTAAALAAAEQL